MTEISRLQGPSGGIAPTFCTVRSDSANSFLFQRIPYRAGEEATSTSAFRSAAEDAGAIFGKKSTDSLCVC